MTPDVDAELERIRRERKAREAVNGKANGKANGHASSNGKGTAPPHSVRMATADQIAGMTFAPIKYVVPTVLVEGLTLFAGKPKIGKSWLVLHAALAVARGGFTLGQIHCSEGDVLYCALEDNQRRLQSRLTKLCGLPPWNLKRLDFYTELPRLPNVGSCHTSMR